MSQNKKYDIFISYRRESGSEMAMLLWSSLNHKYKVFLDVVELGHIGTFDNKIVDAIKSARVFLFMYTPGCMDRCSNENDWVAREIRMAIESGCIIVPLNINATLDKYPFPPKNDIPIDIRNGLGQHQFIDMAKGQLFKYSVDKLVEELSLILCNKQPISKNNKRSIIIIICVVLVAFLGLLLTYRIKSSSDYVYIPDTTAIASENIIEGHEFVDLGLSVNWATCNVGATKPEDYGDYYAWAELSSKDSYTISTNAAYRNLTMGNIAGNVQYDVARSKWGSSWRLPTRAEVNELLKNCTSKFITKNGVNGRLFTSKKNGKSIFLPAAGCYYGQSLYSNGEGGVYWSASPNERGCDACALNFYSSFVDCIWYSRCYGCSIRPVIK